MTKTGDKKGPTEEATPPSSVKKPRAPKIYLLLSGLMLVLAVLSYLFEEWLFDLMNSPSTFVYAITLSIVLALFFLYCYRVPRLGLWLMGRSVEYERRNHDSGALTYDTFKMDTASAEKVRASRRKQARALRRRTARATREVRAKKNTDKKETS